MNRLTLILLALHASQGKTRTNAFSWTTPLNQWLTTETSSKGFKREEFPSLTRSLNTSRVKPAGVKNLINYYEGINAPIRNNHSYSAILQGASTSTSRNPGNVNSNSRQSSPKSLYSTSYNSKSLRTHSPSYNRPAERDPLSLPSRSSLLPSSILNANTKTSQPINITDSELTTLGEELIHEDENNVAKFVTINFQGKTTSQSKEDRALQPLLSVSPGVYNINTIKLFSALLDNYERDTLIDEQVNEQEKIEENNFIEAVFSTRVIQHLMGFLANKGYVPQDTKQQRDIFADLWFTLYSRGQRKLGSSSFEHIFVSELKNGEISGLHNWLYFHKEERENHINYLGYLKYLTLDDKGTVMKLHFNQQNIDKPVGTIFIGTSPELEMALYTLCFITRADRECRLKSGNKSFGITTYTFRHRNKKYIGSAYPQI